MADVTTMAPKLEARVQDIEYPITQENYESELTDVIIQLGYEVAALPLELEALAIQMAQVNFYYLLAGKHSRNPRIRIEGDMEIHSQQIAENYLKLAMALEERVDKLLATKIDTIEIIEASRWRVSDSRMVPPSGGI